MKSNSTKSILVAAATMLCLNASAQAPVQWSVNPNLVAFTANSYAQQAVTKIVTASDGSIITAGSYIDVSPNIPFKVHKYSSTGTPAGEYDDVDAGYTTANGTYTAAGYTVCDMVIDSKDNVFLIGYQNDTVTIGGTVYKGKRCLIKLDANLNLLWKNISDSYNWLSMCLDGDGNVIVNGTTKNANDGTGTNIITAKYDTDGNEIWASIYSSAGNFNDNGNDVAVGSNNGVYITGSCMTTSSGTAAITMKFKSDGTFLWDYLFNYNASAAVNDAGVSIAVGANGNSYILANCNTGLGENFPCVMKIDLNGNLKWSHLLKKTIVQYKTFNSVKIRIDANENVYAGTYLQTFYKGATSYIYKFKANGKQQWQISCDSITLSDFDVTPQGDVYLTGAPIAYGYFGGNARVQAARYDATGNLVWNDWYADLFVPNQILDTRSWARCLSINPKNPDEVTIGGGAVGKDNTTGFYNSAGLVRNYNSSPRLSNNFVKNDFSFNIYPNPATDIIFLNTDELLNGASISIINTIGEITKTFKLSSNQNQIDVGDLKSGIYFLDILNEGKHSMLKFAKQE